MPHVQKSFKFTNDRIKALPLNPAKASSTDLEFSDTELTGLKCLCGKSGSKRFLLRYVFDGRKRSIAIGRFPDIDVSTARQVARKHRALIANGEDPKGDTAQESIIPTVSEFFWGTFIPLQKKHKKSWDHDIQRFRDYCEPEIGHLRYCDLKASHVQAIQLTLNAPTKDRPAYSNATCNRAIAVLKTMGQLAVRLDVVKVNEAMKIKLLKENNARTRFLDAAEMQALVREAKRFEDPAIGGFIAILALTGARNSEIRTAKHEHLDRETRTLFVPITKSGKSRVVYLSDLALEIIDAIPRVPGNPYIFPGRKTGKCLNNCRASFKKMLLRAGIEDVENIVPHTLRHSVASNLVSAGFSLYDVKAQLAHESIESTQRYAKLTVERQRKTSEQISNMVTDDKPKTH